MPTQVKSQFLDSHGSILVNVARRLAAAAIAEATSHGWAVAVAVVDAAGDLVFFERVDDTQPASSEISQGKARTAARFRRSTKVFEEALTSGRHHLLGIAAIVPLEGGIPLLVEDRVVGAIGVSGVASKDDGICAQAGVEVWQSILRS